MSKSDKVEKLISLMFNTGRLIKEGSRNDDTMDPVSMINIEALKYIETEEPTMKQVAEYLHVRAPSASYIVDELVKKKYVKRVRDKSDRRIVRISITSSGAERVKVGMEKATQSIKEIFMILSEKQMDDYINIMEEIHKAYDKKND